MNTLSPEKALRASYDALASMGDRAYFATRAAELAEAVYQNGRHAEAWSLTETAETTGGSDDLPTQFLWRAVRAKLLAVDGRTYDSVGFSRWLEERRQSGRDLCFVIGGPAGLELPSDHRLSFGPLTLPHQLAQVVLLEQLFRAHKILANEPYHL